MIEGTKSFRSRNSSAATPAPNAAAEAKPSTPEAAPEKDLGEITPAANAPADLAEQTGDAVNLERRAWFASLVPTFGDGLVKLLRASNNLQRDLNEVFRESSQALVEREKREGEPK